jgi:hypothetical protein
MATKTFFELMDVLQSKSYNEKLSVIFMWIKSGVITQKQFNEIMLIVVEEGHNINKQERMRDRI